MTEIQPNAVYRVKDVAELCMTRQETVLKWIHSKRLKAGNVSNSGRPYYRILGRDLLKFVSPETAERPPVSNMRRKHSGPDIQEFV